MDFDAIRQKPTVIPMADLTASGATGVHESVFRAWFILECCVKPWLAAGVPGEIVSDWIALLETAPLQENEANE